MIAKSCPPENLHTNKFRIWKQLNSHFFNNTDDRCSTAVPSLSNSRVFLGEGGTGALVSCQYRFVRSAVVAAAANHSILRPVTHMGALVTDPVPYYPYDRFSHTCAHISFTHIKYRIHLYCPAVSTKPPVIIIITCMNIPLKFYGALNA